MAAAMFLATHDSVVLQALFDPEAALNEPVRITDSLLDSHEVAGRHLLQAQERDVLQLLNSEEPAKRDIDAALTKFNAIIESNPAYSSAYNNRAQTRRMLLDIDQLSSHVQDLNLIFDDLSEAIKLSTPMDLNTPISTLNAKVLASAHSHRGYLLLKIARLGKDKATAITDGLEPFKGLDGDRIEELASHELALGGRFGNDVARQLAVTSNPYAKLCGDIVRDALRHEIESANF